MSTGAYGVAAVRAAEEAVMATLPEGSLMRRAATGLESTIAGLLVGLRGQVAGSSVVTLVGSGNNGGDALWASAGLAGRGAGVLALTLADRWHEQGAAALLRRGGRLQAAKDVEDEVITGLLRAADVIVDGVTGIGGSGPLRGRARDIAAAIADSDGLVIAVDIPSGVDADTGHVADASACIDADVTVTFGCLKPGLVLAPGRFHAGAVEVIDIGLAGHLPEPEWEILGELDLALAVPEPTDADYKYSRGVVCVSAGSAAYRGAAYLAVDGARCAGAGMVRYLAPTSDLADGIAARFPDVVVTGPATDGVAAMRADHRVTAFAAGPGWGTDGSAESLLHDILGAEVPVVIDADALRLLARDLTPLAERGDRRQVTVLTPHEGEFAALGFAIGDDRAAAARQAAQALGCVVVLKGPGTVIATPDGPGFIDVFGSAELGTAGSGDVLTGLLSGMLAAARARDGGLAVGQAGRLAAAAVGIHGIAGRLAGRDGRPVTAVDIAACLPDAIARVRRGRGQR